jgi:exodeoxyribonuclease V alpha subunit
MSDYRELMGSGAFSDLDRHFAAFIEEHTGGEAPLVGLAAALVSRKRSEGHICLDLEALAGSSFPEMPVDDVRAVRLPQLKDWTRALRASAVVGTPGDFRPLIFDDQHRLYLHRYWEYEQRLAAAILRRAACEPPSPALKGTLSPSEGERDGVRGSASVPGFPVTQASGPAVPGLGERLDALFPPEPGGAVNWQGVAALAAVRGRLCVISGGPGTGKTHTLVLILALLLELEQSRKLRIAVAAPTGKAAARIQDSIRSFKATLACAEAIRAQLPERATTIHRLLGYVPDSARFRHDADNPLPYDVVAVDEASMVDLALMAKLFDAIPPAARVILLGDKDQLASVEAGAVLGDICAAGEDTGARPLTPSLSPSEGERVPFRAGEGGGRAPLANCIVQLRKNYRFGEQSGIYRLSGAINEGRAEETLRILREAGGGAGADLASAALPSRAQLKEALRPRVLAGFGEFIAAPDAGAALAALGRFRILCALREGPFGVAGLNQLTEEILEEAGLIRARDAWYAHRPIMITRNDYNLKLFNGDIGLLLPEGGSRELRAFFQGPDNTLRKFLPLRLPEHETAYAMTVHKSQGSEFDRVLLILPDRESPILTRELLYTGLTRARSSLELWFEEKVFRAALSRRVTRTSGLRDALLAHAPGDGRGSRSEVRGAELGP